MQASRIVETVVEVEASDVVLASGAAEQERELRQAMEPEALAEPLAEPSRPSEPAELSESAEPQLSREAALQGLGSSLLALDAALNAINTRMHIKVTPEAAVPRDQLISNLREARSQLQQAYVSLQEARQDSVNGDATMQMEGARQILVQLLSPMAAATAAPHVEAAGMVAPIGEPEAEHGQASEAGADAGAAVRGDMDAAPQVMAAEEQQEKEPAKVAEVPSASLGPKEDLVAAEPQQPVAQQLQDEAVVGYEEAEEVIMASPTSLPTTPFATAAHNAAALSHSTSGTLSPHVAMAHEMIKDLREQLSIKQSHELTEGSQANLQVSSAGRALDTSSAAPGEEHSAPASQQEQVLEKPEPEAPAATEEPVQLSAADGAAAASTAEGPVHAEVGPTGIDISTAAVAVEEAPVTLDNVAATAQTMLTELCNSSPELEVGRQRLS